MEPARRRARSPRTYDADLRARLASGQRRPHGLLRVRRRRAARPRAGALDGRRATPTTGWSTGTTRRRDDATTIARYDASASRQRRATEHGATPSTARRYTRDDARPDHAADRDVGGGATTRYEYDLRRRRPAARGHARRRRDGDLHVRRQRQPHSGRARRPRRVAADYDAQDRLDPLRRDDLRLHAPPASCGQGRRRRGTTTYDYDALGDLTAVTLPGGDGRRVRDRRRRAGGSRSSATARSSAGLPVRRRSSRPVAELDADGNVVSRFVYGDARQRARLHGPRAARPTGSSPTSSAAPRAVVDTATGAVAQELDYDEFGRVHRATPTRASSRSASPAACTTADTGLVRFGARDYDAETGRWTAKDPLRFERRRHQPVRLRRSATRST